MADGDGGIRLQQKRSHGLAHNITAAHHHAVLARRVNAVLFQKGQDPRRGAGEIPGLPQMQEAHILRMKSIHIFGRIYGPEHLARVQMGGQGHLDKNAVDGLVPVQRIYQGQKLALGGAGRETVVGAGDAALGAVLLLIAHIHRRGGIVPHQHHRQTGWPAQGGASFPESLLYLCGKGLTVHDHSTHIIPPVLFRSAPPGPGRPPDSHTAPQACGDVP